MNGESAAFDALADGYRREILAMLREGDRAVHEIAERASHQPACRVAASAPPEGGRLRGGGGHREPALYHLKDEGIEASVATSKRCGATRRRRFRLVAENVDPEAA